MPTLPEPRTPLILPKGTRTANCYTTCSDVAALRPLLMEAVRRWRVEHNREPAWARTCILVTFPEPGTAFVEMFERPAEVRRMACEAKSAYYSEAAALDSLAKLRDLLDRGEIEPPIPVRAYRCEIDPTHWHLTKGEKP